MLKLERVLIVHKFKHNKLPPAFRNDFLKSPDQLNLKRREDCHSILLPKVPDKVPNKFFSRLPLTKLAQSWNSLPLVLRSEADFLLFKKDFKDQVLNSYNAECTIANCYSCNINNG